MREKGQIILILILVMTTALGIGLAVIQRSLTNISTSTKVEQSQRAFSAAEAGIETALRRNADAPFSFDLENASADVRTALTLPTGPDQPLEYLPISKEEVAHFWLCNPTDLSSCYTGSRLEIYWGNSPNDKPAIEINIVYQGGTAYQTKKFFFDSVSEPGRRPDNGFRDTNCAGGFTARDGGPTYQCKQVLPPSIDPADQLPVNFMKMLRIRLLYSNISQPVALKPAAGLSLPAQAKIFLSIGTAGEAQRTIQVFKQNLVPQVFLDYAIFSLSEIRK